MNSKSKGQPLRFYTSQELKELAEINSLGTKVQKNAELKKFCVRNNRTFHAAWQRMTRRNGESKVKENNVHSVAPRTAKVMEIRLPLTGYRVETTERGLELVVTCVI